LKTFNSFAVIATHSPIILQEIPGKRVRIFKRDGTYSIVNPLAFESFGENLTMITNEVFEVSRLHNNYQNYLRGLAASKTYDEVLEVFGGRLGLNAKAFLRSLYGEDEGE
jgi:predicted ATP-binding protein involved in virulence